MRARPEFRNSNSGIPEMRVRMVESFAPVRVPNVVVNQLQPCCK